MATTAAYILNALALEAGLTPSEIDSNDIIALAAANDADCGIWVTGEQTYLSAMDEIANSIGAWYGFDEFGVLRMGRLDNSSSGIDATVTEDAIVPPLQTRPDKDLGRPSWRVNLKYSKNYTVQTSDLAGILYPSSNSNVVDGERRAWLANEFRTVSMEEETIHYWGHPSPPNIRERCLLATEAEFQTLLVDDADAQAEVERRWNIYAVKHHVLECEVDLSWWTENGPLKLMDQVRVEWPSGRSSLSGGSYKLIGVRFEFAKQIVTMSLWSIETSGP